jgi:hypothetical protein
MNTLKLGEVKITGVKAVKGGKFQLDFQEIVVNPNKRPNLLGLMNADDDRFNTQKPRYAWLPGTAAMIEQYLGVDVSGLNEGDEMSLDITNPQIGGYPAHIEIIETTEASEYDKGEDKNGELAVLSTAKQYKDKEDNTVYILSADGQPIFTRATVQLGAPKHSFITDTKEVSSEDFEAIAAKFVKAQPAIQDVAAK